MSTSAQGGVSTHKVGGMSTQGDVTIPGGVSTQGSMSTQGGTSIQGGVPNQESISGATEE